MVTVKDSASKNQVYKKYIRQLGLSSLYYEINRHVVCMGITISIISYFKKGLASKDVRKFENDKGSPMKKICRNNSCVFFSRLRLFIL